MFTCGHCHTQHQHASSAFICAVADGVVSAPFIDPAAMREAIEQDIADHSPARTPVTEAGMYRIADNGDGESPIFKVQRSPQSGHLYAKKLVVERDKNLWDGEGETIVRFEYAPGAIKLLAAEDRMTLDEAKAFGALYGTCCVCGRTLTNETSIEAGIGPVCGNRI